MDQNLRSNILYTAVKLSDVSAVKEILMHASADEVNKREGNQVCMLNGAFYLTQ